LPAIMGLAVSYSNENYHYQACRILKEWILGNPRYSEYLQDVPRNDASSFNQIITSILPSAMYNDVRNIYLKAIRSSPNKEIDADMQNALGVLHCLMHDNAKAIDCFKAGLASRPDDYRLWNRLGATLANDDRPAEAVPAYRKALELAPGFIRARYNLAITCIHLKTYGKAVELLLEALNKQEHGQGLYGEKYVTSDSIWSTLRLAISLDGRKDLSEIVHKRDLKALMELGVAKPQENAS